MEKFRDLWVRAALIVSLLVPMYFLVAALGTKFGLFPWTLGFVQMTFLWGVRVLLGAAALALLGLLLALFVTPRRGVVLALIAFLIPAFGVGYGMYVRNVAAGLPPIHDISTDLTDPPTFSAAVVEARAAVPNGNHLELLSKHTPEGRSFTDLQQQGYPDVAPILTAAAPGRAYEAALALAQEQDWTVGRVDAAAGVFEATDESLWFGFIDDIVVRVRPDGSGSRVDMRSVSRVGRSDLGVNAARMRPYLQELRERLEAEGS
jgi:uncharacterized protein (DUF1499 family)